MPAGPFLLLGPSGPSSPLSETAWLINDIAPLPVAMQFDPPGSEWVEQYWGPATVALDVSPAAVKLAASANIGAGGTDATAAVLIAPAGKTTADFQAGQASDDTDPLPSLDLAVGKYTELVWCLTADGGVVADADVIEFRVTRGGALLDAYSVVPGWTVGTAGAGAFTAAAVLTASPATLAASATFAPGTKTATAAFTASAATLAASATFAPGTKTATADLSATAATLAAAATFAPGTKTATAVLAASAATLASAATFSPGTKTATSVLAVAPATLAASAAFAASIHLAVVAVSSTPATLSASAQTTSPVYAATAALSVAGANLAGVATFAPPAYTGAGIFDVSAATLSATATFTAAAGYTAAGVLVTGSATLSGAATFTAPAPPVTRYLYVHAGIHDYAWAAG